MKILYLSSLGKAILLVILFVYCCGNTFAQNTQIPSTVTDLPKITPPSPTVAAFMKFEEVPVNKYTGIPDITIPLYSVASHSKDISVDLSLKYHPSSIAIKEEASYVGLGWNLFGGGTISRTVRGVPDEKESSAPYGIHTSTINPYFIAIGLIGSNVTEDQINFSKFIWDANVNGRYDTEHDLYQFNFMGYSGRFIITNRPGQGYRVEKLDNDNAINITYNSINQTFVLYDDKGYKYTFDVKEQTKQGSTSQCTTFDNQQYLISSPDIGIYTSAFQLSKIHDQNGNLLIQYNFGTSNEASSEVTTTINQMSGQIPADVITHIGWICPGADPGPGMLLEPKEIRTNNTVITATKKITQIIVTDIATIDFTYAFRQDTNNSQAYRLKSIVVKNNKGDIIKNIELFHGYSDMKFNPIEVGGYTNKRMILTKVSETYGGKTYSHEMEYIKRREDDSTKFNRDYWGYITAKPDYEPAGDFKETHWFFCKMDLLQKMKLPTGGSIVYQFEPNTYSYIGSSPIADFGENPFNWSTETLLYGGGIHPLRVSNYDQKVHFKWTFHPNCGTALEQLVNGQWIRRDDLNCSQGCTLEAGEQYRIRIDCRNGGFATCNVTYFGRNNPEFKYLYGGGVRIAKIGYFEENVDPLYYECKVNQGYYGGGDYQYGYKPAVKEILYDYQSFNDSLKSSGSLVFAKPVFSYSQAKRINIRCMVGGGGEEENPNVNELNYIETYNYDSYTDFNNLKPLRTHGSDVGYKNVQVTETGNGYSRYEYKSPIDIPEESYTINYPFLATSNRDNERGFLINEKHYNERKQILKEINNNYTVDTTGSPKTTGINVWSTDICPFINDFFGNHLGYLSKITGCLTSTSTNPKEMMFCAECKSPVNEIGYRLVNESYGWQKLMSKTIKDYYYDANNVQKVVQNTESFTYDSTNKKIATYQTVDTGTGEALKKIFTYYTGPNNQISNILNIKSYSAGVLTNQDIVDWGTNGGTAHVPLRLRQSKTNVTATQAEVIQEFYSYDTYGNILSMSDGPDSSGLKTIVWGYNNTLPIAIIEGDTHTTIMANTSYVNLIAAAKQKSDTGTEAELILALTNLRNALTPYMVTTYTHKPLVGATSITDSRGYITTYKYDDFSRLETVKDASGNLLSENKYNYKTSN